MKNEEKKYQEISNFRHSSKLKGALSNSADFTFLAFHSSSEDIDCDYLPISIFVPEESFKNDMKNDIFISEHGAVANAYDFSALTDEERIETIRKILEEKIRKYPNYDFKIKIGKFPIKLYDRDSLEMSTHILYITNYEELLTKAKKR